MITYIKRPNVEKPMNAEPGLYMEILCETGCVMPQQALEFVSNDVRAAGYNPLGRAELGPPCQHGIVSRSHSLWFFERIKKC